MNNLPAYGTVVREVIRPTYETYTPLLTRQSEKIRSTPCETFQYGPHLRQTLDLYTPAAGAASRTASSVLLFFYGGGFVGGDRIISGLADGLVYANIGHYFAENLGFPVAIADYRLLRHGAIFPSGGEDMCLAIEWLARKFATDPSKPLSLYLLGNSAGGVHLYTYLLEGAFRKSRCKFLHPGSAAMLKGAILLSVPCHFKLAHPETKKFIDQYGPRAPLELLKAAKEDASIDDLRNVPIMLLTGTLDPVDIVSSTEEFIHEWQGSPAVQRNLITAELEGHNHISPGVSLGTGVESEERWGRQVVDFIKGC